MRRPPLTTQLPGVQVWGGVDWMDDFAQLLKLLEPARLDIIQASLERERGEVTLTVTYRRTDEDPASGEAAGRQAAKEGQPEDAS